MINKLVEVKNQSSFRGFKDVLAFSSLSPPKCLFPSTSKLFLTGNSFKQVGKSLEGGDMDYKKEIKLTFKYFSIIGRSKSSSFG